MILSKHDVKVQKLRDEERLRLIEEYERVAAEHSGEFGFLNILGQEVPDPTIVDPPLGYVPQPDLMEMMRRMIRNELAAAADLMDPESFQDADDFDIDDDPVDYSSPYEEFFDPPPGAPPGPPGEVHPARQDPNQPPAAENGAPPAPAPENAPASS